MTMLLVGILPIYVPLLYLFSYSFRLRGLYSQGVANPRRWDHQDYDRVRGGLGVPPEEGWHRTVAPFCPEHPSLSRQ